MKNFFKLKGEFLASKKGAGFRLRPILFVSRHEPTEAQYLAFLDAGFELVPDPVDLEGPDDGLSAIIDAQIASLGKRDASLKTVAGVFPVQTIAALKKAGFTTISTATTERGLRVDMATADQLQLVVIEGDTPPPQKGVFIITQEWLPDGVTLWSDPLSGRGSWKLAFVPLGHPSKAALEKTSLCGWSFPGRADQGNLAWYMADQLVSMVFRDAKAPAHQDELGDLDEALANAQ